MGAKTERIKKHLAEHPADYQSVVALYRSKSADIEYEIERRKIQKRRLIAECKRRLEHE